jgi:hypothetical protein
MKIQNIVIKETHPTLEHLSQETITQLQSKRSIPRDLAKKINDLPFDQLKNLVDTVATSLAREKAAPTIIAKFGEILDKEKLEMATEIDTIATTAREVRSSAEKYFEIRKPKSPTTTLNIQFYKARDCLVSILESGLDTFNLTNIFNSSADPATKTGKILALFTLLTTLTAILIPLIGLPHGILGIATLILVILAAQHLYQYIRPTPVYLAHAENWSKKYWKGDLSAPKFESAKCKILATHLKPNQPLMLIGPSGCGKTEMIKSLVKNIEQQEHPHLKRKRLFYVNSLTLTLSELQNIVQSTKKNKNNLIMVFDNLQDSSEIIRKQLNISIKDQKAFPYFIGITTGASFVTGAKTILLAPPSNLETALILQNACTQNAPEIFAPFPSLKFLAANTSKNESANPKGALTLLSRCIDKTSKDQEASVTMNAVFFKLRDQLHALKEKTYTLAFKVDIKPKATDQKTFLLFHFYLFPALEKAIREEAQKYGLETEINEHLIKKVLDEESS